MSAHRLLANWHKPSRPEASKSISSGLDLSESCKLDPSPQAPRRNRYCVKLEKPTLLKLTTSLFTTTSSPKHGHTMSLITTSAVGTLTIDGREQEKKKHKSGPTGAHQRIEAFNDVPFFPGSRSMLGKTPGIQSYEYRVPVDLIRYANLSVLSLSSGDSFHDVLGHGSVGSFSKETSVGC